MVTGMSQNWLVGPIAKHAGTLPYGGYCGFKLGFAFLFTAYCALRPLGPKYFGQ
jgi:hypothetical protein